MEQTHKLRKKENFFLVETLQPLAGRGFPQHTLPYNGLITHILWRVKLNWLKIGPVHLISDEKKMGMVQIGVTHNNRSLSVAQEFLFTFFFFLACTREKKKRSPCSAWELTQWDNFFFGQEFDIFMESMIMVEWYFWTMAQFIAVAPKHSAIQRWHSFFRYLMLAAVKVSVTGTNYQCQIIILKKRLMLAREQT